MKLARPLLAAALLALTLAACSRDEPERPPTNTVEEPDIVETPTPTPTPERPRIAAPDAEVQSNAIDELADTPREPDAQMMDDAAATGMTARAARDEPTPQETPSEVVEQK